MSALLDELIERRRQQAIDYQKYLQEIRELAQKVLKPAEGSSGDSSCKHQHHPYLHFMTTWEKMKIDADHRQNYSTNQESRLGG